MTTNPMIQIGLWNVSERKLYEYLQAIENDYNGIHKISARSQIHADLFESLELADTNKENYKLLLKIAKGTFKARLPKNKRGGDDELRTHRVKEKIIEYEPDIITHVICRDCKGSKKCWCCKGKKGGGGSDGKQPCDYCDDSGLCDFCNKDGMIEWRTSTNKKKEHNPDNWTEAKLSEKQMKLLSKMKFNHHVILALMWDFSLSLDEWIEKQLVKDKDFLVVKA